MDEREGEAAHAVFDWMLDAGPEPQFPSVTEAALAGGRRMRRRRTAASVAGTLTAVAAVVTVAFGLAGNSDPAPVPIPPAGTVRPARPSAPASPSTPRPPAPHATGAARATHEPLQMGTYRGVGPGPGPGTTPGAGIRATDTPGAGTPDAGTASSAHRLAH